MIPFDACCYWRWNDPFCRIRRSWWRYAAVYAVMTKAPSTPATMSKQRSTLLPKTATMSNEFCVEILSFRQSRTLLRHCCPKRQHCRSNKPQSCLLLRQRCFDIVASVDRSLQCFWMGRKTAHSLPHLIHSFWTHRSHPQTASRSVQPRWRTTGI